ncbi:MAG: hypothetical protein KatS3mg060_0685 [Dehalococcoidia bacterium]|jgi:hypothetical protein|nr:MAG: hypothetical protein KatS3mg060_0685 [Dehalococcoidia bacterium]
MGDAMAAWERELWEANSGVWISRYTVRDATGVILDQHEARNDIAIDWATNRYAQRNVYTRGDTIETRRYLGHFEGGRLVIESDRLVGVAWPVERRVILLNFRLKDAPTETFELITLVDERHRARVMQHIAGGRLAAVTSVFDEVRVSAEPAIDAAGNDLP